MLPSHQSHRSSKHTHHRDELRREQRREERGKRKDTEIAEIVEGVSKMISGNVPTTPPKEMDTSTSYPTPLSYSGHYPSTSPRAPGRDNSPLPLGRVEPGKKHTMSTMGISTTSSEGIDVLSAETKTTFENLVKYLSRDNMDTPNLVYTAQSVIECISSIYLWARVDRNSPIKIPRSPGDQDVLSMYPEGSVVTVQKPTRSQENLRAAVALDSKCDDDAMSAISGSITGHRRRRNNGSVVSTESTSYRENWTRDMDPPTAFRGVGARTMAVPQYNRAMEDSVAMPYPTHTLGRPMSVMPGELINRHNPPPVSRVWREPEPSLVSRIETPVARPTTKTGVNNFRIARRNKNVNNTNDDDYPDDRIA